MIGVKLSGRLGNQMFQYASAFSLAKRHRTEIILDTSNYWSSQKHSEFELWRFPTLGLRPISRVEGFTKHLLLKSRAIRTPTPTFYKESLGFEPSFFDCPDGTQLYGYFQSARYFESHQGDIKKIFSLERFAPYGAQRSLRNQLRKREIVSVHVRRGDYLTLPVFNVNLDGYYRSSIDYFRGANRVFLVTSDDVGWCKTKEWFQTPDILFLSDLNIGLGAGIEEMALMSMCSHHIIANSTFSWWAAYLNPDANKRVVMPRQWLAAHDADECGIDVPGWVQY